MNNKGLSLIELMIVLFVSTILLGGTTSLIYNMVKSQQAMMMKSDQHSMHAQMLTSMGEASSCEGNFVGLVLTPGTTLDLSSRFLGAAGNPATSFMLYSRDVSGTNVPRDTILSQNTRMGGSARVTSIRLEGIQDLGSGTVKADLVASVDPGPGFVAMADMRWEGLMFVTNPSYVVQSCLLGQRLQCAMADVAWRSGVCSGATNYATISSYWPQQPSLASASDFVTTIPTASSTTWGANCNGPEWIYTSCSIYAKSGSAVGGGTYSVTNTNGCVANKNVAACADPSIDTRMYITCCRTR